MVDFDKISEDLEYLSSKFPGMERVRVLFDAMFDHIRMNRDSTMRIMQRIADIEADLKSLKESRKSLVLNDDQVDYIRKKSCERNESALPELEELCRITKSTILTREIKVAINRTSRENESNTPDFILAKALEEALGVIERVIRARDQWYGINPCPFTSTLLKKDSADVGQK